MIVVAVAAAIMAGIVATVAAAAIAGLPRRTKAQIVRQYVSPVVLAAFGDARPPASGPRWAQEWEPDATRAALARAAGDAFASGTLSDASLDNALVHRTRFPFAYQDFSHPRLALLDRRLQLSRLVSNSCDEFELFRRVTSLVRETAEHTEEHESRQVSYGAPEDAFSILDAIDRGETLQCHAYTLLLVQCLAALGFIARQASCGYFDPREHVVVEAWSPAYLKWILLDPDNDLTYTRDRAPLNAYDAQQVVLGFERAVREWSFSHGIGRPDNNAARQALLADFLATRPELLEGVRCLRGTSTSARVPRKIAMSPTRMFLELHRSFAVSLRNDHLTQRYPLGHPRRSAQLALSTGAARWLGVYDGAFTDDLDDLYWSLHSVRLAFRAEPPGAIRVRMGTFTPGFQCFRVSMNGCTVETSNDSLAWRLNRGVNTVSVSAVNLLGRIGRASSAVLHIS